MASGQANDLKRPVQALKAHWKNGAPKNMRATFADNSKRFSRYSLQLDDLLLDWSKCLVDDETFRCLAKWPRSRTSKSVATQCFRQTNQRYLKAAQCCTSHCAIARASRSRSMAKMSCLASRRCSIAWRPSPTVCDRAESGFKEQADHRHRQYRHRWLRSWTRHGHARHVAVP